MDCFGKVPSEMFIRQYVDQKGAMEIPEKYKQQWNIWDVRGLILLSLSIQIVLIFLGYRRKTSPSRLIRLALWSSYLLADWVASFVLGKLSSIMDDSSSNGVLAFWAPFLLLHLGGPDTITAYSFEDNELWARHLLILSYEIILTVYVIFCSLLNNCLFAPTLLIFLVAIIKYVERSYLLYKASIEVFHDSMRSIKKIPSLPTDISSNILISNESIKELNDMNKAFVMHSVFMPSFVDLFPPIDANFVRAIEMTNSLHAMSMELSYAYDELYTKAILNHSRVGYILRVLCSVCLMLAFSLFVLAPKDGFDKLDVVITYVLLVASICLDVMAAVMLVFSDWMVVSLLNVKKLGDWGVFLAEYVLRIRRLWHKRKYWSEVIPQLNLMSNCIKNVAPDEAPRQRMMNWITKKLGFVQEIKVYSHSDSCSSPYTLCTLQPVQATQELEEIFLSYAYSCVQLSQEELNKPVGFSVLQKVNTMPDWVVNNFSELTKGLSLDQQVIVWHIATELCYNWKPEYFFHPEHYQETEMETVDNNSESVKITSLRMDACKCLSNYMMHMVLMQSEMMSTKGRATLIMLWDVCFDMEQFIRDSDEQPLMKINITVEEVCKEMMTSPLNEKWDVLPLVVIGQLLAHLMLFIAEENRWDVVTVVWVELMLRVAMNTRGSMHMKQLSGGVELLTFFWLLNKHVGKTVKMDINETYSRVDAVDHSDQLISKINPYL